MKKESVEPPEIKLVGITVRTCNEDELDPIKGKIAPCVQRYFHNNLFEKIPLRKRPQVTYCAYTEYESNFKGAYTYFIGEEVSSFEEPLPEGFCSLVIPKQKYIKMTTERGPMPHVVMDAWQSIWTMSPDELGGGRSYGVDFEVYDERAKDHGNVILDIYVGVK